MIIISFFIIGVPLCAVCYWLGRGRRLNYKIKHRPEDVAVDLDTGELIERGTAAWDTAVRRKAVEFK